MDERSWTIIIIVTVICGTILLIALLTVVAVLISNGSKAATTSLIQMPTGVPGVVNAPYAMPGIAPMPSVPMVPVVHQHFQTSSNGPLTPFDVMPGAPGVKRPPAPTLGAGMSLDYPTPPPKLVELEDISVTRRGATVTMSVHLRLPYSAVPGQFPSPYGSPAPYSMHQQSTGYDLQKHMDVALHSGRLEQYLSYYATRLIVTDLKYKFVDSFNIEMDIYLNISDGSTTQSLDMPLMMGFHAVLQFIGYELSNRRHDSLRVAPFGNRIMYSDWNVPRKQKYLNMPPLPDALNYEYQQNLRQRTYEEPRVVIDKNGITVNSIDPTKYSRMAPHSVTSTEFITYDPDDG